MERSPSPSQQSQHSSAWPPTQQEGDEEDSVVVGMSMADVDDEEGADDMGTGTGTQPHSTPSEPEPEPEEDDEEDDEEDEEEGETVVEGEPPALEEPWGEGVKGEEYFGAVVWQVR